MHVAAVSEFVVGLRQLIAAFVQMLPDQDYLLNKWGRVSNAAKPALD